MPSDLGFKANNFQPKYTLLFTIVNIRKQRHNDFSHSILAAHARPSLAIIHVTTGACLWHLLTMHASLCLMFNSVWHMGAPVRYSTVPFYASGHVRTITREGWVQGDSLSHQWDGVPSGARDPRLDCILGTTLSPYITFAASGTSFVGIVSTCTKMRSAVICPPERESESTTQCAYCLAIYKTAGNLHVCSCVINAISKITKIYLNEPCTLLQSIGAFRY